MTSNVTKTIPNVMPNPKKQHFEDNLLNAFLDDVRQVVEVFIEVGDEVDSSDSGRSFVSIECCPSQASVASRHGSLQDLQEG